METAPRTVTSSFGKLLPGDLGGGVDRGAALVDHDDLDRLREVQFPEEGLRLPARRAVPDGDRLDPEPRAELPDRLGRLLPRLLREVGEDRVVVEELSLGVEADELAPRPEAGIEGEEPLLAERRGEEELAEVVGEDADRLRVGPFLRGHADLRLHGVGEKPPVAVLDGHPDLFGGRAVSPDEHRVEQGNRLRLRRDDAEGQELLLLAAPHREDPVGRRLGGRLFPVEIVPVPASLRLLPGDDPGLEDGLCREELPHPGAGLFVFVHPFGDDVPGPGERLLRRGDALFRIDEGGRRRERVERLLLGENLLCERFQPLLPGDGRPRPPLGAEGEVDVLENGEGSGGGDLRREFVGEEFALRERFEDRLAPLVQLGELGEAVADVGDLHLVEGSRRLLPVAGDEGHRRPFAEELRGRRDLRVCRYGVRPRSADDSVPRGFPAVRRSLEGSVIYLAAFQGIPMLHPSYHREERFRKGISAGEDGGRRKKVAASC